MKSLALLLAVLPLTLAAQDVTVTRDADGNITLSNPAGQPPTEPLDLEGQPTEPLDLEGQPTEALDLESPAEVEAGERVYSWIDEEGVVHYSDQPQGASGEVETVDLTDQPVSSIEDAGLRDGEEALIQEMNGTPVSR